MGNKYNLLVFKKEEAKGCFAFFGRERGARESGSPSPHGGRRG
ncbi:hypothetical protein MC7420_1888 [Coleofasciculus chthonoplastes PCC 7420]|uniref:Uncharacterized protein n=1 Tax=Coleofasciculus chthonoplastes PCC 7420 TaxID=118168 RepID=B4VMQ4_9CYAN|nr:hypothetical protein MC7420_1888 [Coleofasciculus chthonoplastes PCC 7420]